jgi:hypothetical protein
MLTSLNKGSYGFLLNFIVIRGNRLSKSDSANVIWLSSVDGGHLCVEFSRTVLLAGDTTGDPKLLFGSRGTGPGRGQLVDGKRSVRRYLRIKSPWSYYPARPEQRDK